MEKSRVLTWIKELAETFAVVMILITFVVRAFKIPSPSMVPTLIPGDKIFVNRYCYIFGEPRRGDVVVFKYPRDPRTDFIKRVAAFGGEEIAIVDGKILINGQEVKDKKMQRYYYSKLMDPQTGESKLFEPYKVPEGTIFALGDNSRVSADSRYWGPVPRAYLKGKAFLIWWPPSRIKFIK